MSWNWCSHTTYSYRGNTNEDHQEPSSLLCPHAQMVVILFSHGREWKPFSHVLGFIGMWFYISRTRVAWRVRRITRIMETVVKGLRLLIRSWVTIFCITACVLFGRDSYKFWIVCSVILYHSSWRTVMPICERGVDLHQILFRQTLQ